MIVKLANKVLNGRVINLRLITYIVQENGCDEQTKVKMSTNHDANLYASSSHQNEIDELQFANTGKYDCKIMKIESYYRYSSVRIIRHTILLL